jgi:hypothetical protein
MIQKSIDAILLLIMILGTIFALYLWHYHQTFSKEKIDELFESITSKYGIKIAYEIGDDFFSPIKNPPIPAGPPKNSQVKPIRHRVLVKYPEILKKSLEKYPIQVIKDYLTAIYFAGEIDADGDRAAGTYDPFRRLVYIVDNGANEENLSIHIFHHEFSSILLRSHSFWVDPWTDHHPKNFKYFDDLYKSWQEVEEKRKKITDKECFQMGFVSTYGLTNFSNDFSEYSAMIFTDPKKFKQIMAKYPRVRGKFKVWLEFYQKIDPIFTEEYLLGKADSSGE